MKLDIRLKSALASASTEALREASKRKASATETIEDAWVRILSQKNSDADLRKLREVKRAMDAGLIGREAPKTDKRGNLKPLGRFSKAEAIRLYAVLFEQQREAKLAELVAITPSNYVLITDVEQVPQVIADIQASDYVGYDCETFGEDTGALDPWKGDIAGFSISANDHHYYVPIAHTDGNNLPLEYALEIVRALTSAKLIMHNAPFDCKWAWVKWGIDLAKALYADTRIMAMALDENASHRLKDLLTSWLKEPSDNFDELFAKTPFNQIGTDVALAYAAGDTEKTLKLFKWMMTHFNTERLSRLKTLVFDVEMPVQRVFIKSDLRGMAFDIERAAELDAKLEEEEKELLSKIYAILGREVNLNSPAQMKVVFFEELGITDYGKGSTSNKFLKKAKNEHPIVPLYLEYKEIGKLRQAFTQKLPNEVKSDGRIHPWHNTWGAATGRFTCKDPNTQQIPAKRPEVRHLFKTLGSDRILVSIDYSQIELRVLAHEANDQVLIDAFKNGQDIHSTTAALISKGEFTYEEIEQYKDTDGHKAQKYRKQAKIVNFGIVYGMGASTLANTLEITPKEGQTLIDNYFAGYPGIAAYMERQHRLVRKNGYVEDLLGRKRRLHKDIKSRERWKQLSAERMAGNFPIQSGAGGILKKALIDLDDVLPQYDVNIVSQTHDEILYDCPRDVSLVALEHISRVMAEAVTLNCPVNCDIEIYPERWQEKVDLEEWFNDAE
ncbi:DNA polymerase [Lysinibacillus sp. TE18511]